MTFLKERKFADKAIAFFLAIAITLTALTAVIVPQLNHVNAADLPGTAAYYDARWKEAKVKVGNLPVGTHYTNYLGNAATTIAEGPWKLDIDYSTCSSPWGGSTTGVAPTQTVNGGAYNRNSNPYMVYSAGNFRWCVVNNASCKLREVIKEKDNGELIYGNTITLTGNDALRWNGKVPFYTDDLHRVFEVGYYWSLADGRYLYDSKRIEYPDTGSTHDVKIKVENDEGYAIDDSVYVDAYSISMINGSLDPSITANFGSNTREEDAISQEYPEGQPHGFPAAISWKLTDDPMIGLRIAFTYIDPDNGNRVTQEDNIDLIKLPQNPGENGKITVNAPYRAYTIDSGGHTVWKMVLVKKEYDVTLDTNGEYRISFKMDKPDYGTGVYIEDVDMDIEVTVVVDKEVIPTTASLALKKLVSNYTDEMADQPFAIKLSGGISAEASLKNGETSKKLTTVMTGSKTFNVSEIIPMEYGLIDIAVTNAGTGTAPTIILTKDANEKVTGGTITIHPGNDILITVTNEFTHDGYFKDRAHVENVFEK